MRSCAKIAASDLNRPSCIQLAGSLREHGTATCPLWLAGQRHHRRAKDSMRTSASFSPCRTYRYELWREWAGGTDYVVFVGLNPSTADEAEDDATIRRCIGFAKAWGYGALCVANLFAYCTRWPQVMKAAPDPVGPDNNQRLLTTAAQAAVVVAAWGTEGTHLGRDAEVRELLPRLHCLRLTKHGHPAHPLYLPKALQPVRWEAAR